MYYYFALDRSLINPNISAITCIPSTITKLYYSYGDGVRVKKLLHYYMIIPNIVMVILS